MFHKAKFVIFIDLGNKSPINFLLPPELTKAEIKAEAYDEMINVAESELGISIRKKSGAKQ